MGPDRHFRRFGESPLARENGEANNVSSAGEFSRPMRALQRELRKAAAMQGGGPVASEKFGRMLAELWPPVIGILLVIAFAAWAIFRIRARYRDHADSAAAERQMLLQMGELRRGGDLSDEEYRSIKGRLIQRLDDPARRTGTDISPDSKAASNSR